MLIVHYHTYKTAGSSLLKDFKRVASEREQRVIELDKDAKLQLKRPISGQMISDYLSGDSNVFAVSSHMLVSNSHKDLSASFPVVFVRHPLLHAASVYRFERKTGVPHSPNRAILAKRLSFKEWVLFWVHSSFGVDCNNFQSRLLLTKPRGEQQLPTVLNSHALNRCTNEIHSLVDSLPFIGVVERYNDSLEILNEALGERNADFGLKQQNANVSKAVSNFEKEIGKLEKSIGNDLVSLFEKRNQLDFLLYRLSHKKSSFS